MFRSSLLRMGPLVLLTACPTAPPLPEASTDTDGPDDDASNSDGESSTDGSSPAAVVLNANKDVDILFVIDNSGSMGEEQLLLSSALPLLVDRLDQEGLAYRIGVTTTDNGNYWCPSTSPEGGNFVFESCRSRLADFMFLETDASGVCTDFCPPEWGVIEQLPTTIAGSADTAPRPWIESIGGVTNLPAGLTTIDALLCLVPQGIAGCGFESHLESMHKGLLRAEMEGEDEYGFLRDHAAMAIVLVTDEADCSYNRDWETIFLSDAEGGNEVFWSLPDENSPTSAVCWNAGVTCDGGPGVYDTCFPQNKDVEGNFVSDAEAEERAVLHPVARHIDLLQGFEDAKQEINPGQEVIVAAITGVPQAYPSQPLVYADGPDPTVPGSFQSNFGIGPGCSSPNGDAVPPVRIKALADAFMVSEDDHNLFSVCEPSYEATLSAIADAIADQIRPACMRACVADDDPVQEGLQPQCTVVQEYRDENNELVEEPVPACEAGDTAPADVDVCYTALTDRDGLTESTSDDMSAECIDEGWNLEFRIVRRAGVPAPGGASVLAECSLSQNKAIDCPDLP